MQIENEAVQIEVQEAMQIEAQARVSDRANQDLSDTHLPATAWPRQMFAAVRPALRGQNPQRKTVVSRSCTPPSSLPKSWPLATMTRPSRALVVKVRYVLGLAGAFPWVKVRE